MVVLLLLLAACALIGYAIFTQYKSTDPTQTTAKRVWASLVAGAGALGAALVQWIHSVTSPGP
jgi:hypothetical protein